MRHMDDDLTDEEVVALTGPQGDRRCDCICGCGRELYPEEGAVCDACGDGRHALA